MSVWVVADSTGQVVNLVEWDGIAEWSPPEGHVAFPQENVPPTTIGQTTPIPVVLPIKIQ
jgi:hypothetical protein